nr:TlpA disulfide reductase family protein [Maliibacterium massiliense]
MKDKKDFARKKNIAVALALLCALLLAACAPKDKGAPTQSPPAQSGAASQAPAGTAEAFGSFTSVDLAGQNVSDALFSQHELTMVNVWATFCGPCLREMPDLGELYNENQAKDVNIVGIVLDVLKSDGSLDEDQVTLATQIASQTGASYTHILPSADLIRGRLQEASAVPTTFFVDRQGNLVGERMVGSRSKAAWQKIIDERLALAQ